jgi:CheY-like chemotaxis protein
VDTDFSVLLTGMRDDFLRELPERCDLLEDNILALGRGVLDAFDHIYWQIHSLKDSGGTFGIPIIIRLCQQFESFVASSRGQFDPVAVSYALSYVDLLRDIAKTSNQDSIFLQGVEQKLDQLRISSMPDCASVLLVEPSVSTQKFCRGVLESLSVRMVSQDRGLPALELLLHQPFDLLVAARELADLNALALVAALRESGCCNKDVPVILISSNVAPPPAYLKINATIKRNEHFVSTLAKCAGDILASCRN